MSEETKDQAETTEVTDEQLTEASGAGPHVKVFDGSRVGAAADGELPLKETPDEKEGLITGKITYDGSLPRS